MPQLLFNATQVAIRDSVAYLISEARLSEVHELSTSEECQGVKKLKHLTARLVNGGDDGASITG